MERNRHQRTLAKMIGLYCHAHHGTARGELCVQCATLCDYALQRLANCPYAPDKLVCALCPIHCYRPAERERIRQVMRYAGPRLLWHAPGLALMHLVDRLRSKGRIARGPGQR